MTPNISFTNPGEIDIHAITTLGVNVKESESPIGFFGTGLKYAIAVLLREAQSITIWSGLTKLEFYSAETSIRGKMFGLVMLRVNDTTPRPLGFTTELGKNWTLANAYRELYSNMRDEGGTLVVGGEVTPAQDKTIVSVVGDAFKKTHDGRNSFILADSLQPIVASNYIQMFRGGNTAIFYQNIAVFPPNKPTTFTYNFLQGIHLTEDRTASNPYLLEYYITEFLCQQCKDPQVLELALSVSGYELHLDYSNKIWSEEFTGVVEKLTKERPMGIPANLRHAFFSKKVESIENGYTPYTPSPAEQKQVEEELARAARAGIPIKNFPILFVESLGQHVTGMTDFRGRKILVSRLAFQRDCLLDTLLEEYIHLASGAADETREFQNYAISLLRQTLRAYESNSSETTF